MGVSKSVVTSSDLQWPASMADARQLAQGIQSFVLDTYPNGSRSRVQAITLCQYPLREAEDAETEDPVSKKAGARGGVSEIRRSL